MAVIDFGTCGVGGPACDLSISWTLFQGESRQLFRATLGLDESTWARARGWTLWKALITLAGNPKPESVVTTRSNLVIAELIADYQRDID